MPSYQVTYSIKTASKEGLWYSDVVLVEAETHEELFTKVVDTLLRTLGPSGNYYVDSIGENPYEPRPRKRIAKKRAKDYADIVSTINALNEEAYRVPRNDSGPVSRKMGSSSGLSDGGSELRRDEVCAREENRPRELTQGCCQEIGTDTQGSKRTRLGRRSRRLLAYREPEGRPLRRMYEVTRSSGPHRALGRHRGSLGPRGVNNPLSDLPKASKSHESGGGSRVIVARKPK